MVISAFRGIGELSRQTGLGSSRIAKAFWGLIFTLLIGGCASKLVDFSELGELPSEYSQNITQYQADVVDPNTVVEASQVKTDRTTTPSNVKDMNTPKKMTDMLVVDTPKTPPSNIPSKSKLKSKSARTAVTAIPGWKATAWPYGIGEVAEYSLRYGLIDAGVVTMKVLEPKVIDGETALHYLGNVKSTKLLELFYKVDDTIESWVTMSSHLPIRQEIHQRESAQWGNRVVAFNRKKQTAKFYATTEKHTGKKKVERFDSELDHYAQDLFGAMYFWRFVPPTDRVNFAIHDRGKNWSNESVYMGTDTLDLPIGKTKARHYKLKPRIQGHLEPKGDVDAWYADDDTRVMVRFRAGIKFGTVTGDLKRFQPGQRITIEPPQMRSPIDLNSLGRK